VLIFLPTEAEQLDSFLAPKELVLHLAASAGAVLVIRARTAVSITRADALLTCAAVLSACSTLVATNPWWALRTVGITTSGILIFLGLRAFG
jgi:hypothetical protein